MIFKQTLFVVLAAGSLVLANCSNDDPASSTNSVIPSEMYSSVSTANSKMAGVADLLDGAATFTLNSQGLASMAFVGIGTPWTTVDGVISLANNGSTTLKQWFSDQFNEDFQNSNGAYTTFSGRIKSALDIFCFISQGGVALAADNLPTVGQHTISLSAAMSTACNSDVSADALGQTVIIDATATTNTAYYDRFLDITLPWQSGCNFKFYARVSSTFINIAQAEDQTCDGRDQASGAIFSYDIANQTTRFYYISRAFSGQSGYEVYRGYLNEATDTAYVVGFNGGDDNQDTTFESGISFTAVGKPVAGGTVAVSTQIISQTNVSDGTYQGCIDAITMNVTTDDSLACTVTGQDASATHSAVIQGDFTSFNTLLSIYNIGEGTTLNFTDETDIFL